MNSLIYKKFYLSDRVPLSQKLKQEDKGGSGIWKCPKKNDVINEQTLKLNTGENPLVSPSFYQTFLRIMLHVSEVLLSLEWTT